VKWCKVFVDNGLGLYFHCRSGKKSHFMNRVAAKYTKIVGCVWFRCVAGFLENSIAIREVLFVKSAGLLPLIGAGFSALVLLNFPAMLRPMLVWARRLR
jgi:hypothetical protein